MPLPSAVRHSVTSFGMSAPIPLRSSLPQAGNPASGGWHVIESPVRIAAALDRAAWRRPMKAHGRVIVVTGAGSGIGREVVLELLRRGARVAAVDVNEATLDETAVQADAADRLSAHVVNITDRAAVDALPRAVAERFGSVDGLIHCAGIIQPFVRVKDMDDAAIDRVFGVNWTGTLNLTRVFLPVLLARPEGHIVNVSSMGGFLPVPGQTIYGASKAAVKLFTEGLHSECAGTRVHVTVVFPGAVATNITTNSGVQAPTMGGDEEAMRRRIYPADRAARDIVNGMERNAYRVMVGRDVRLMDVLYRVNPSGAAAFIARQMKDLLPK
jgi:NAD(P)-dependent dehydrogenase (short-subunit alcohol dehydrogenase family)